MTSITKVTRADVDACETADAVFELFGGELSRGGVSRTIRELDALGYSRGTIAKRLGKRYQHVRNVLIETAKRKG